MTAFVLGERSRRELQGVHPFLVRVVEEAIKVSQVDFAVHDGLRTEAEQREYVRRGVSQTMRSMHMKQADGFGHAVDLVPFINGKLRWEWPPIFAIAAAVRAVVPVVNAERIAAGKNALRIRWGGAWTESFDAVEPTAEAMELAEKRYVAARVAAGKRAFPDGPHFEIAG